MIYIVTQKLASKFARNIQAGLTAIGIRSKRTRFPKNGKSFNTNQPVLNKVQQYVRFRNNNIPSPAFVTNPGAVAELGAGTIFARTLINSTNGRGIVEFSCPSESDIPVAPLYTKYIPKDAEYRLHVFDGAVIDVQQKKKKIDFDKELRNPKIRNLANGYIYSREGVAEKVDHRAFDIAIRAVGCCGYLYGAVDIIYNKRLDSFYVLEVNSKPGLEGTTLINWANAVRGYVYG